MTYEILLERYLHDRITKAMLQIYVKKGIITKEQYEEIIRSK